MWAHSKLFFEIMVIGEVISVFRSRNQCFTFDGIGGEESQVLGFKRVLVGEFSIAALRLRLSRQRRVVYFEASRLNDTDVSGNAVAKFDFDDITDTDLFGFKCLLETLSHDNGVLRHHVLERFHNFVTFALLVV